MWVLASSSGVYKKEYTVANESIYILILKLTSAIILYG
jgi:hypothetical protein